MIKMSGPQQSEVDMKSWLGHGHDYFRNSWRGHGHIHRISRKLWRGHGHGHGVKLVST